jgi:hypothetical protein
VGALPIVGLEGKIVRDARPVRSVRENDLEEATLAAEQNSPDIGWHLDHLLSSTMQALPEFGGISHSSGQFAEEVKSTNSPGRDAQ